MLWIILSSVYFKGSCFYFVYSKMGTVNENHWYFSIILYFTIQYLNTAIVYCKFYIADSLLLWILMVSYSYFGYCKMGTTIGIL